MDMGLTGKVVLVTGGNSGIGAETTRRLAEEGAKVAVHALKKSDAEAWAKKIGHNAKAFGGDLAKPAICEGLVERVVDAFGRLDGLVNNAGIFPRAGIAEADAAIFDRIFAINARAPMLLAREAVKAFRKQKSGGAIVNIGSINAYCGQPDLTPYSMSKGAILVLTRNLADALCEEGIRVNQVNPGWIFTAQENITQLKEGRKPGWEKRLPRSAVPRGAMNRPEEVAEHILFWLSPRSAPASGQVYEMEQYPVLGRLRLNSQ